MWRVGDPPLPKTHDRKSQVAAITYPASGFQMFPDLKLRQSVVYQIRYLSQAPLQLNKRLMKKSLSYVVALLFAGIAVSFAGPDKAAMEAKEKAAWQAFKDKKADDFKKVVDKDIRCVYDSGIMKMQDELDAMQKWDMKSFEISDLTSFSDEKDVVVTTYTVKLEGTYDGHDMTGTYNCGSVWKEENGKWLAIFHTNIKQEKQVTGDE